MRSDVAFDSPYLNKYLRFGWYLDIIMLIIIGDILLMFGSDSVVDMDDWDYTFDDGWSNVVRFFFRSIVHLIPYWGIFPFRLRFTDLHGVVWLSPPTRYTLRRWLFVILSWSPKKASLEPFSQTHTFRHLDVIMLLLLKDVPLICGFNSAVDMDD